MAKDFQPFLPVKAGEMSVVLVKVREQSKPILDCESVLCTAEKRGNGEMEVRAIVMLENPKAKAATHAATLSPSPTYRYTDEPPMIVLRMNKRTAAALGEQLLALAKQ